MLREAVTNFLRHSAAAACVIEVAAGGGSVRPQVSNDGAPARPPDGEHRGHDLANLTARLHAVGGHLTTRRAGGWFDLTADILVVWPLG